jgi:hypothetical protein
MAGPFYFALDGVTLASQSGEPEFGEFREFAGHIPCVLGRLAQNDSALPPGAQKLGIPGADKRVSRQQCIIKWKLEDHGYCVEPLGSSKLVVDGEASLPACAVQVSKLQLQGRS